MLDILKFKKLIKHLNQNCIITIDVANINNNSNPAIGRAKSLSSWIIFAFTRDVNLDGIFNFEFLLMGLRIAARRIAELLDGFPGTVVATAQRGHRQDVKIAAILAAEASHRRLRRTRDVPAWTGV